MDDNDTRMKTNMEKVLRAMDVIPPFRPGEARDSNEAPLGRAAPSRPQGQRRRPSSQKSARAAESAGPGVQKAGIPEFDLGERILAEQRRVTARKRRPPGAAEGRQADRVDETQASPRMPLALPGEHDLMQLQRIVADIVARDIESLCRGPGKSITEPANAW